MGLDLKLLPARSLAQPDYSADIFSLDRDTILFEKILLSLHQHSIPSPIACFLCKVPNGDYEGEYCFGEIEKDAYGKTLYYIKNKDLLSHFPKGKKDLTYRNYAVKMYLRKLPEELPIYIYWC